MFEAFDDVIGQPQALNDAFIPRIPHFQGPGTGLMAQHTTIDFWRFGPLIRPVRQGLRQFVGFRARTITGGAIVIAGYGLRTSC